MNSNKTQQKKGKENSATASHNEKDKMQHYTKKAPAGATKSEENNIITDAQRIHTVAVEILNGLQKSGPNTPSQQQLEKMIQKCQECYPRWNANDIGLALKEADFDLEETLNKHLDGQDSWTPVEKKKKEKEQGKEHTKPRRDKNRNAFPPSFDRPQPRKNFKETKKEEKEQPKPVVTSIPIPTTSKRDFSLSYSEAAAKNFYPPQPVMVAVPQPQQPITQVYVQPPPQQQQPQAQQQPSQQPSYKVKATQQNHTPTTAATTTQISHTTTITSTNLPLSYASVAQSANKKNQPPTHYTVVATSSHAQPSTAHATPTTTTTTTTTTHTPHTQPPTETKETPSPTLSPAPTQSAQPTVSPITQLTEDTTKRTSEESTTLQAKEEAKHTKPPAYSPFINSTLPHSSPTLPSQAPTTKVDVLDLNSTPVAHTTPSAPTVSTTAQRTVVFGDLGSTAIAPPHKKETPNSTVVVGGSRTSKGGKVILPQSSEFSFSQNHMLNLQFGSLRIGNDLDGSQNESLEERQTREQLSSLLTAPNKTATTTATSVAKEVKPPTTSTAPIITSTQAQTQTQTHIEQQKTQTEESESHAQHNTGSVSGPTPINATVGVHSHMAHPQQQQHVPQQQQHSAYHHSQFPHAPQFPQTMPYTFNPLDPQFSSLSLPHHPYPPQQTEAHHEFPHPGFQHDMGQYYNEYGMQSGENENETEDKSSSPTQSAQNAQGQGAQGGKYNTQYPHMHNANPYMHNSPYGVGGPQFFPYGNPYYMSQFYQYPAAPMTKYMYKGQGGYNQAYNSQYPHTQQSVSPNSTNYLPGHGMEDLMEYAKTMYPHYYYPAPTQHAHTPSTTTTATGTHVQQSGDTGLKGSAGGATGFSSLSSTSPNSTSKQFSSHQQQSSHTKAYDQRNNYHNSQQNYAFPQYNNSYGNSAGFSYQQQQQQQQQQYSNPTNPHTHTPSTTTTSSTPSTTANSSSNKWRYGDNNH